jgi:hypothetical protein
MRRIVGRFKQRLQLPQSPGSGNHSDHIFAKIRTQIYSAQRVELSALTKHPISVTRPGSGFGASAKIGRYETYIACRWGHSKENGVGL